MGGIDNILNINVDGSYGLKSPDTNDTYYACYVGQFGYLSGSSRVYYNSYGHLTR